MDFAAKLKNYANLIIKSGVNIQKGQILMINSPIESAYFARLAAQAAYDAGASEVVVKWNDEKMQKINLMNADVSVLSRFDDWVKDSFLLYAEKDCAYLVISSSDPEIYSDVPPEKFQAFHMARMKGLHEFSSYTMNNKLAWNIVCVPSESWAKKVFPQMEADVAVEKLWESIFKASRADEGDAVEEWDKHVQSLQKYRNYLNQNQFVSVHLKNSLGTDLEIGLPENQIWGGGSDICTNTGVEFNANIPTEEIFCAPHKDKANGKVVASMPLVYNGNMIDGFSLTFKDGKVVEYSAEKGLATLETILNIDEGAKYLGELALVPYTSPISDMNILFYNTLYDENASCHLAIGRAYAPCIKDGSQMSNEELAEHGLNYSLTHVDFMFGTSDLEVVATAKDGSKVQIFKDGNWAV